MLCTGHLIEKALQKGMSSRMAIWSQELGEYDIEFHPRTAIKGQSLADFVAEFSCAPQLGEGEAKEGDREVKEDKENNHNGSTKKRTNDPIGPVLLESI